MSEHAWKQARAVLRGGNTSNGVPLPDNLRGAYLVRANLANAILNRVNLHDADLTQVKLSGAILIQADLKSTNLNDSNLMQADLKSADLSGASLDSVNLDRADLTNALLIRTNLSKTDLSGASLLTANLTNAALQEANLTATNLRHSNLTNAHLTHANLANATLGHTTFAWVDLSHVRGLDTIEHDGPSAVDINSVILPYNDHTRLHFLRGIGFSDTFMKYLPSLQTTAVQYASCFIGYAHQDEVLAKRLYQNLQDNGIRCWIAPHDLRPGDYHHIRIDEAIHLHEKVLLLLSEHAINSSWVKHEVQITLAREITQDRIILFPLRLDQAIMHTSKEWAAQLRESRHIGDFTDWQDESAYQHAFAALLRHLRF